MVKDAFEHKKWHILGLLFIATIPAVCIGFVFGDTISRFGQSVWIVVIALIVVGALMIVYGNERKEKVITADEKISKKQALTIGIAQAIALIPGVSRSGITILSGLRLGFSTKLAADFSFLLAIPIIFGASMRVLLSDEGLAFVQEDFGLFLAGNIASFLFGALAISTLLKYLRNHGLAIFGWYRIGLALVLSALLLTGVI
jgi:undecaprenyl-diphosphatase